MQMAIDFLARKTDPVTSHQAAEKAESFKARHIAHIWNALKDHGKLTPREISTITGLDYHAVQRRGAEMERKKLIVRGAETKDGMMLWSAA